MKDWRTLLIQYPLQQNKGITGEDKVETGFSECKQPRGMPLLSDLAVMMRINPLALVFGLRELWYMDKSPWYTVVYGPVMSHDFHVVQVKAVSNSVLYVKLVSVEHCFVLNWVKQKDLRGLVSDGRFLGTIAEPGWMLIGFYNNFKVELAERTFPMSRLTLSFGICDLW